MATDIERARGLVASRLAGASEDELKAMLCAVLGHPPVVTTYFGYIYCARCSEQIGDALGGAGDAKGKVVVGHDCEDCRKAEAALTDEERLLTQLREEPESSTDEAES